MTPPYVSPPRSPTPNSARPGPSSSGPASADSLFTALSQPSPPTLREVLSAYASQEKGDREMLIALLKAKAAEDERIANLAKLHQQVTQMQITVLSAHIYHNLTQSAAAIGNHSDNNWEMRNASRVSRRDSGRGRSPVSPSPPHRRRLETPARARAHPYSRVCSPGAEDQHIWAGRRSWDSSVSDERGKRTGGTGV
ncbi:hypothetical protein CTheo_8657 [Ceratobasidium theobromae]|uniref:Uncharacterized protein n=1 Tax=Ceratobasidium theobromae TaxID=1582974 RepID=A0A5N5Q903_9AGAM|nr:hypothetical protein CTheo_8657 [Ceratobasidium theobromae]